MNTRIQVSGPVVAGEDHAARARRASVMWSRFLRYRFVILSLMALGVGVILILSFEDLPSGEFWRDIGIALVTAATVGLGVEFYARREFVRVVTHRLERVIERSTLPGRIDRVAGVVALSNELTGMGFRGIHPDRAAIDFRSFLAEAEPGSEIHVLGVCMHSFADHAIQDVMRRKLGEGCTIKLLILAPASEFVRCRALGDQAPGRVSPEALRHVVREISNDDEAHRSFVDSVPDEFRANLMLGHYDAPAEVFIISNGRSMVVGFYLRGKRGDLAPHFELEIRPGGLHVSFDAHFNALWASRIEAASAPPAVDGFVAPAASALEATAHN